MKPIYFVSLSLAGLLASCSQKESSSKKHMPTQHPKLAVSQVMQLRPAYNIILPGTLKPYEQVEIYAKMKSFVKKIYVDRGSIVQQGELLAALDAPELNEQYLSNRSDVSKLHADYLFSKQSYRRLKEAAASNGAVSAIELERAKSKMQSDSAAYVAARSTANAAAQVNDYLRISAPFDGVITSRNVSAGALVGEGNATPLFTIAQKSKLRLTVSVPEKYAASVNDHTQITFHVNDYPGRIYTASISRSSRLINEEDHSVTIEFDVDNKDGALNGGEYAQVRLQLQRHDSTLWVPASSIVHAQSGVFVEKPDANNIIRYVPVAEGNTIDSVTEVFGQLRKGDTVLKTGSEEIQDKQRIN